MCVMMMMMMMMLQTVLTVNKKNLQWLPDRDRSQTDVLIDKLHL